MNKIFGKELSAIAFQTWYEGLENKYLELLHVSANKNFTWVVNHLTCFAKLLINIYFFFFVLAFILTYMFIDWADKENVRLSRKNPKDYENDK